MNIRDRIIELQRIKASDLAPHPLNYKVHTDQQRQALRVLFQEVGFAGVALVYRSEQLGGKLTLIDAHMRQDEVGPDFELPCAVTDLNDAEAAKLLALGDRVAQMAESDPAKVAALLQEIDTENDELDALLASLAEEAGVREQGEAKLVSIDTQPPPAMSWILIGIPTVRFGEVSPSVEALAKVEGIIIHDTVTSK